MNLSELYRRESLGPIGMTSLGSTFLANRLPPFRLIPSIDYSLNLVKGEAEAHRLAMGDSVVVSEVVQENCQVPKPSPQKEIKRDLRARSHLAGRVMVFAKLLVLE